MDRLTALIQDKQNPTVVGLDPRPELLPGQLIEQARQRAAGSMARMGLDPKDPQQTEGEQAQAVWADHLARAYLRFNLAILEGVADLVP
ncbi:MAG: orotidine-5'-phosphate decarboxylase, partial [Bifidobacteriales bacterium]|nr:orotidine-5'-phosphate decarboxylase [Bifidobacteriales bacterium]